mmetsp:Transcript_29398/g.70691  ORF Transcript_29398/g.70691 Transcript_29398/m.70691 type:complete len:270 (+) Transcript_29398:791-1600(+)
MQHDARIFQIFVFEDRKKFLLVGFTRFSTDMRTLEVEFLVHWQYGIKGGSHDHKVCLAISPPRLSPRDLDAIESHKFDEQSSFVFHIVIVILFQTFLKPYTFLWCQCFDHEKLVVGKKEELSRFRVGLKIQIQFFRRQGLYVIRLTNAPMISQFQKDFGGILFEFKRFGTQGLASSKKAKGRRTTKLGRRFFIRVIIIGNGRSNGKCGSLNDAKAIFSHANSFRRVLCIFGSIANPISNAMRRQKVFVILVDPFLFPILENVHGLSSLV